MKQFFLSVWGLVTVAVVVLIAGSATGYFLSHRNASVAGSSTPEVVRSGNEVGLTEDTKTFTDSATGVIQKGGINGEGTHQLVRDGGPSQTVYLLSSVVDLDEFVGKKAEVWGETIQAQKAGWLMDVGRVKILD